MLSERVKAVSAALATVREPVTASDLAKRFARAKPADVAEILEFLCVLGKARRGPPSAKARAGQAKANGTFLQ
jgi:chromosome segregation and condensation protein ScpB